MLPIANRPMLFYGLDDLKSAGIEEVGIILGPIREGVVEAVGDGSKFGLRVTYIDQMEPKGLADAVRVAKDFLNDENFIMYLGDNLLRGGACQVAAALEGADWDCVIGTAPVKEPQRYGIVVMRDGKIDRLVEKPQEPAGNMALVGVYGFTPAIFEAVEKIPPSRRGELEITDAIQWLLDRGKNIHVMPVEGWWKDTGRPEDLLEANQLVLADLDPISEGKIEENANVVGSVSTGSGTVIMTGSHIRGPCIIGTNSQVGPGAIVGPYTSVGNGVKIMRGEIENSIVMDGVEIDCEKRIVNSLIGRGTRIISNQTNLEHGLKFVVGESTFLEV